MLADGSAFRLLPTRLAVPLGRDRAEVEVHANGSRVNIWMQA